MKNIILSALLCIGTLAAQAQGEFTVRGKVTGVEEGSMILLMRTEGNVGRGIARDTVKNGSFLLKGKTLGNEVEQYSVFPYAKGFPSLSLDLWVLPGSDIRISGEGTYHYTWKVENPIEQQQIRETFVENARELWDEYQRNAAMRDGMVMWGEGERGQRKALCDSLDRLNAKIRLQIDSCDIALMKRMPVSEIWMDKLRGLAMQSTYVENYPYKEQAITFYNGLTEEWKNTALGKTAYTHLFPPTVAEEGDEMADADLYDLEGNIHHLADFKGKYILVDIWSSGCGPCISALPEMKEISEQYKDKLTLVSLSCDRKGTWERASQNHPMTWYNLNDLQGQNGLYAKYGVRGIPGYILISPEGKVVKKWTGYGDKSLHLKMRRWLHTDQHIMSVSETDGKKTVNYPSVRNVNIEHQLIKQVELTDTATIVHMRAYYYPNYWIGVSSTLTLIADNGKHYPLLRTEGITPDKEFFMPESGEAEYTFYFEPMPRSTKTFDMIERAGERPDRFEGISLVMPEQ